MKRTIGRPDVDAVLSQHPERSFGHRDVLNVPSGYEAVLVRDGVFSVYREGDAPELGKGLFKSAADLYFVCMQPTGALPWGTGGIVCAGHPCGLHGTLRLRVSSSRKFLNASLGGELPISAQRLFERLLEGIISALRSSLTRKAAEMPLESLAKQPELVAREAEAQLEELLEAQGLSLEELFIEEIFIADSE